MKIQLPGFVLADLYARSLVITETPEPLPPSPPPAEEAPPAPELYLGGNARWITILVNDAKNRYIDDAALQLLVNVLSALQLTLQDVALVNISRTPLDYRKIGEELNAQVCLMFDVSTQQIQLPFQMPDYKVQLFSNCKFLACASLNAMKGNSKEAKVEKTKLWMCLKSIFE